MTPDEYRAFEDASPVRHEFVGGRVYAMSGGKRAHSRVSMNIAARLFLAAQGGPCRVHQAEVKLRIGDDYYYPDVMAACGPEPADEYIEDAPCFVAEVLSPSTRRTDLTEKPAAYARVTALQLYLIADPRRRLVELYRRGPDGAMQHAVVAGHGEIALPCPALTLTLDQVYAGLELPAVPTRRVRERAPAYGRSREGG
jgi:Uma2 family endonuclease